MSRNLIRLVSFFSAFLFSISSFAASRIEFILDVSGSMNAMLGSEKRIDSARKAISSAVNAIPDGTIVALRLYGHRIPPSDKAGSCKDSQLVVPFGPINKSQIIGIVNQSMPLGQTPIAFSLEQAAADFGAPSDEQASIILVSDGEESCGGDPIAVAKALIAKGFKLKIHTIGLDVDANARAQLEAISSATGGQYKDARDPSGLANALQELTRQSLLIKKEETVYGDAIRGGDSYETAIPIQSGKLYRLDHHQRKSQFDYFYVDLKAGQKMVAQLETGLYGVSLKVDGSQENNSSPYAGIAVHNNQRQEIKREEIIGDANAKKSIGLTVPSGGDGRYYVLIGSTYDMQHKDNRFQVNLISQGDGNTPGDASDVEANALEIQPGNYDKNYLSKEDKKDIYKVNLNAGTSYEIKARVVEPSNQGAGSLSGVMYIEVYDMDGVKLFEGKSANGWAVAKVENFIPQKTAPYLIHIQEYWHDLPELTYSFSVMPAGAATSQPASQPSVPVANTPPVPQTTTVVSPASVPTTTSSAIDLTKGIDYQAISKQLGWMQLFKLISVYVLAPGFGIFLFGLLFGYIWGRRSGKRKALAQIAKAQEKAASTH
ncbi:MAG: VWA domain-containing protein [Deltaproteobacteria bacterium]|nr:VWA domain-containing protein [Deltaproteobacteria bacterium]